MPRETFSRAQKNVPCCLKIVGVMYTVQSGNFLIKYQIILTSGISLYKVIMSMMKINRNKWNRIIQLLGNGVCWANLGLWDNFTFRLFFFFSDEIWYEVGVNKFKIKIFLRKNKAISRGGNDVKSNKRVTENQCSMFNLL